MSALFDNPAEIHVHRLEDDSLEFTATHRRVPTTKRTTDEGLMMALAAYLCRIARNNGDVGAVVFNNATEVMPELSFLVADDIHMRDADDEDEATEQEVSPEQEARWTQAHKAWARKHRARKGSRRPARETVPPTEEAPVREYEDDPQPAALPPVEDYDPPAPTREAGPSIMAEIEEQMSRPALADSPPRLQEVATVAEEAPPARRKVSGLDSLMDEDKHPQHAQDGWRSSLNALGLRLPPGKDEKRRRDLIDSILAGWDGPRIAMLLNEKGSGGKTPWALLLAAALQRHSRGRVVVRDGNPTGNAHERAEYVEPLGVREDGSPLTDRDLARYYLEHGDLDAAALARFLYLHTTDKFGLVAHHVPEDDRDQLDPEEVDASLDALIADHIALINDSGNNPYERRDVAVIRRADQLLLPMLTYPDRENGARKTAERLESWAERPGGERYGWQLENAIAVVNTAEDSRLHRARAEKYAERWQGIVREVVVVPFDPHMASHNLRFGDLRLPTRTAVLEVAAAVAEGFRAA